MKILQKLKNTKNGEKRNFDLLLIITFFTGVLIIFSSYAWFYASLNVKVEFFNMIVSDESGLFISLDGVDFSSSVQISKNALISDLKATYPNHTNQWASAGLISSSSNGTSNPNSNTFDMFASSKISKRSKTATKRLLDTIKIDENESGIYNIFISFDIFLKNVTGSPKSDNLFLNDGTSVYINDENKIDDSDGTINSIRFGFLKLGSVSNKADINAIQNIQCDGNCEWVIYEPNSKKHSEESIERAKEYGVNLVDGIYFPTYAVISEGKYLELANGQPGSNIPLDTEHFALQKTMTDFKKSLFSIPNGITKVRIYVWLEGQDIDSLETKPKGADIAIVINFLKDLAGYE